MKVYTRNGFWQVEFEVDGTRKRLAVGLPATATRGDAERAATERMRKAFSRGEAAPDKVTSMAEALERCYMVRWSRGKSLGPIRSHIRTLQAQVGHWMLRDLTYRKLQDLQQKWTEDGQKPASVNRRMSYLRTAVREARKIDKDVSVCDFPQGLPERNQRDRYLTDPEEATVLAYLGKRMQAQAILGSSTEWATVQALMLILVDTGMRLGEGLSITRANVQGTSAKPQLVLKGTQTKTSAPRIIPLTARAAAAVSEWFELTKDRKIDKAWVQHRWNQVRKDCGIPDVNLHILRHTCAVRLLRAGVGIYTVSKWLGHSSVQITERYSAVVPDMLEDALARLARRETTNAAEYIG